MTELYKTKMSSDYFTVKGLETRTGISSISWSFVVIKELIDNALDAIEANSYKQIEIEYANDTLRVFDNGTGLSVNNIKDIYDFDNYASKNRHIITPSRGKQGNGLKTIIGMCYINDYKLFWHTSDGIIVIPCIDSETINDEKLGVDFTEYGRTIKSGIEIGGIYIYNVLLQTLITQYSECNPDVNFILKINQNNQVYEAMVEPVYKTGETSLAFYNYQEFNDLLKVQNQSETYKSFLERYFGTRIKNSSQIKDQIANLDHNAVRRDFEMLRGTLSTKPFTLLRKHLLGYSNSLEVSVNMETGLENLSFPCMVEFDIKKLANKNATTEINCFINNSITYNDGRSINFKYDEYKISNTKKAVKCYNLSGLLKDYSDYAFNFHFITPYPKFTDYGKTELDISDFIDELVDKLRKALHKEKKRYESAMEKSPSKKSLAKRYMTDAFLLASTNGQYSITARQMYYKLREIINDPKWESDNTYKEFTQNWLTTWLEETDEFESKVNFSERGNFYVEGSQVGLGTANVRNFIDLSNTRTDKFQVYGGLQDDIHISDKQFNIRYKYDKALYIEKTGFDSVFRAERLDEKYNLLIVSGQGYASRAARRLLHTLQEQGLKLFCLHDLDIAGVTIFSSMRQANEKFEHDLDMVDLGITLADVAKYSIVPERTEKVKDVALEKLDNDYRAFFDKGSYSQRVELNAFTTKQLLEIIDDKLGGISELPTINLSQSLELNNRALREVALMRVLKNKYSDLLEGINLDYDLGAFDGILTLPEAKQQITHIKDGLINQYVEAIQKKIAI